MTIVLIGESGDTLGSFSLKEAEDIAKERKKTLNLVNKQKNIYKLVDMGKEKYNKKQKEKQQRAQQRAQKIKEIKLRPVIDIHDLEIKYNQIVGFLEDGVKTKIIMNFFGRHIANKEVGLEKFNGLVNKIMEAKIATKDKDAAFDGKNMIIVFSPNKV